MNSPAIQNGGHEPRALRRIWLSLPFVFLLWRGLNTPLLLYDFWWHLKLGELILATRSIPSVDLFSFTAEETPFIAQSWLAEIMIYVIYSSAGLPGLVVLATMILLLTLFVIHSIAARSVSDARVLAVADLFAVVALMLCSNLRTQLASFLFFAVVYLALEEFRAGRWKKLLIVPPVMALWVNIHGAFVLGLALFGFYVIFESVWPREGRRRGVAVKGAMLLAASTVATLANPWGWRIYEYVAEVSGSAAIRAYAIEWQPPRIDELEMIIAVFAPAALVILLMFLSRRRPSAVEILLVAGFLAFALLSRRNAIWFSLIAAPIVARQLGAMEWVKSLGAGTRAPSPAFRRALNGAIVVVLAVLSILFTPWVYPRLGIDAVGRSILDRKTPVKAIDFIEEKKLTGRMFHPQLYGDYIIWRLWPQQKTFIDGRIHLFPIEVADGYVRAMNGIEWEELFRQWQIRYVLLSRDEPDSQILIDEIETSARWTRIYSDERSLLFAASPDDGARFVDPARPKTTATPSR